MQKAYACEIACCEYCKVFMWVCPDIPLNFSSKQLELLYKRDLPKYIHGVINVQVCELNAAAFVFLDI